MYRANPGIPSSKVTVSKFAQYSNILMEGSKVFIEGRAQAQDEKDAIVICDNVISFDNIPRKLWIQFETMDDYEKNEKGLFTAIKESDGNDTVIIYIKATKQKKVLPKNQNVCITDDLTDALKALFGDENIKVTT